MQSENRFFDDFARMAQGAFNALSGARSEVEALVRQQIEHLMGSMNLVTREEFDTAEAMLAKSREAEESLLARVEALEKEVAELKTAKEKPSKSGARAAEGEKPQA